MDKFLQDKGVPLLVRKALKAVGSGGKFEFAITDGKFCETEIGMVSNKKYNPIPLNGEPVQDKGPDGSQVSKTSSMEAEKYTITESNVKDPEDQVIIVFTMAGAMLKRTFTNVKTSASFTACLVKI